MAKRSRSIQTEKHAVPAAESSAVSESKGSVDSETAEIERLAHQFWQERGSPIGTPEEDWFRAEEEIRRRGVNLKAGPNES